MENITMKNILKTFGALLMIFLVSCQQTEDFPFETFDDLEKGAFARLIAPSDASLLSFTLTDGESSSFEISVEFYDESNGSTVTDYNWVVRYDDASDPANSTADADYVSIPSSAFNQSPSGLPGATWTVTLGEAAAAVGKSLDELTGGSKFVFNATLKTNKGQEFTSANTGSSIQSSAPFSGFFFFNASLVCESTLNGTLSYVHTNLLSGGGGPGTGTPIATPELTGTVEWQPVDGATGSYLTSDASFGLFPELGYEAPSSIDAVGTVTVGDACNIISTAGADQYGDSYTYTIDAVDGADLTITWENTWGDGGTVVLTRDDGADWPADLKN
jgi:hypothetical protein